MNIEQERADFGAWHIAKYGYLPTFFAAANSYVGPVQERWEAYQAGRAALQSQTIDGWKEAFKAWKVCASIHREWAKCRDALFTTRQADFVRHAEDAFKKSMGEDGLQSQDREDAGRLDWLREETCDLRCINVPTGGDDYDVRWVVIQHHMSKPHEREIGRSFTDDPRDAIDHARRAEGEANG